MKKILLTALVAIILLLLSGYAEVSYCHYWTTTPPMGSPADYIKTTGFCRANAYSGLPGAFFLSFLQLVPSAPSTTTSWNMFNDPMSPITFRYPSGWKLDYINIEGGIRASFTGTDGQVVYFGTPMPEVGYEGEEYFSTSTVQTMDGHEISVTNYGAEGANDSSRVVRAAWLPENFQDSFIFSMQFEASQIDRVAIFNQIISTIRFTK